MFNNNNQGFHLPPSPICPPTQQLLWTLTHAPHSSCAALTTCKSATPIMSRHPNRRRSCIVLHTEHLWICVHLAQASVTRRETLHVATLPWTNESKLVDTCLATKVDKYWTSNLWLAIRLPKLSELERTSCCDEQDFPTLHLYIQRCLHVFFIALCVATDNLWLITFWILKTWLGPLYTRVKSCDHASWTTNLSHVKWPLSMVAFCVSGDFFGIISWDSSVFKSDRLQVDI